MSEIQSSSRTHTYSYSCKMAKVAILDDGMGGAAAIAHSAGIFHNGGKLVMKWNVDEVCDWIISIGFPQLTPLFRKHAISGAVLPKLNEASLKEMGVDVIGHRILLLNEIVKIQAVARSEWRNQVLWASAQYRPGPCGDTLPYGFPCCFASFVGSPSMYTLTNSKLNIQHSTKRIDTPCTGFCGYLVQSNNTDLSVIVDVDAVASTTAMGVPLGFVNITTVDGKYFQLHLKSSECQKATALITNGKEEAVIVAGMQAMAMMR